MRIIGGLVGWMSPCAKILGGLEPLGPHEVGAYVHVPGVSQCILITYAAKHLAALY